ncbi:MAG: UDP-2,4-diacetamido-2,4,6-trideoxy-beta-L-altropyranose hydrolase [Eubacteriales bacterium]|nr:UDP-2,4-diacetamido-2,4,6-trideoxy-beta-L-altropyranose hydrolase [Eubacteriales bacterium]
MESHPLIYIRTDGNETIATGHLMRCLSIARALRKRGALPVFIVSDPASVSLLQRMITPGEAVERAFTIMQLQTDYRNPEREIPVMQSILSSHNASCLLVDSYFVTPKYLASFRQLCRTAYLDDLQAFDYPVSLVINYDLTVDTGFYTKADRVLAGGAYAPLREQFSLCPYHPWGTVRDLFLSTGGTDPFHIAGGLAERLCALESWKDVRFHILTGPMHTHRAALSSLAERDSRVVLHENIRDMASLMASCDLAVSAAGTTLYELCAVGVPSVSYTMADNQIPGAKAFARAGLIPWAGDVRNHPDFFDSLLSALGGLRDYPEVRQEQSARMRMAVDGAGAARIAEALTQKLH